MSDASDARIKALVNALTLKLSEAIDKKNDIEIKNIEQKLREIFESNRDYDDENQEMTTMRTNPTYENDDPHLLGYITKSANNPLGDARIKEYWRRRLKTLSQNGGKKYYYKYKSNKKQFKNRRQRQTKRRQHKTKKRQRMRI
jgi:hypothetical protein